MRRGNEESVAREFDDVEMQPMGRRSNGGGGRSEINENEDDDELIDNVSREGCYFV